MIRRLAIGGLVVVAVAGAAWTGVNVLGDRRRDAPQVSKAVPDAVPATAGADAPGAGDTVQLDAQDAPVDYGKTPMAERVAVLGLLNKRNGVSRDVTLRPGQAIRVGDIVVRLRACEKTAPWEAEQLTGAFVQLAVRNIDGQWRRVFSGWLYKERPQLNVVLHPVYDVWAKSCTVSFPEGAAPAPASPSSAKKSPAPAAADAASTEGEEAAPADEPVAESASPSNAM